MRHHDARRLKSNREPIKEEHAAAVGLFLQRRTLEASLGQLMAALALATDDRRIDHLHVVLKGFALLLQGSGFTPDEIAAAMTKRGWAVYRAVHGHEAATDMLEAVRDMTVSEMMQIEGDH